AYSQLGTVQIPFIGLTVDNVHRQPLPIRQTHCDVVVVHALNLSLELDSSRLVYTVISVFWCIVFWRSVYYSRSRAIGFLGLCVRRNGVCISSCLCYLDSIPFA